MTRFRLIVIYSPDVVWFPSSTGAVISVFGLYGAAAALVSLVETLNF